MGYLPCSVDGKLFPGAAQHFYAARVRGRLQTRVHLRLCQRHFAELADSVRPYVAAIDQEPVDNDEAWHETACCKTPPPEDVDVIYMTAYPRGLARHDFSLLVHQDCNWNHGLQGLTTPRD